MSTTPCPCGNDMAEARAALPAAGEAPDRVVTMVHGTFARHAPWMREGPLFDALQALPGSTVISRFCWSGANAHTDRLRAGDALAGHLRGLASCHATARHFVIGHSHGGNVMLYAMKDSDAAAHVAGVVTMATPFLSVRRRKLHPLVLWGIWVVCLLGLLEAVLHLLAPEAERHPMSLSIAALTLLWAGGVAFSALLYRGRDFGWRQLGRLLLRRGDAEDIVGAELDRLKLVPEGQDAARLQLERMLVARPFGDEASMSLVVSQFLGWAQNRILTLAASLAGSFWKPGWFAWTWKLVLMGFMVFLATLVLPRTLQMLQWAADQDVLKPLLQPLLGDWAFVGSGVVVFIASLMLAVMILFGLLALLCVLVLMAAGLPFGPDAMFWNLYASITAESSPPGSARVFLQSPPPTQAGAGLAHSGVYTDPVVIQEIVNWIRARGDR